MDDDFYSRQEAREARWIDDPREPSDFLPGDEPDSTLKPSPAQRDVISECFAAIDRAWQVRSEERFEQGGRDEPADEVAYADARETAGLD